MAPTIRKMAVKDLVDAKRLDSVCWTDLLQKAYGIRTELPPRTDENLLSFLHADPNGSFVADDEQAGMVGTCFSHVWGNTGWVGPLSVLPGYQTRGIGKDLLKASLAYLEDEGCVDIGLETMPENATNIGMYLKVGLRPEGLVLYMAKKLEMAELDEEPAGAVTVEVLSESSVKPSLVRQMKGIANSLRFGLDYSVEVDMAEKFSFGDTVVANSGGKVVGFTVIRTKPRRERQTSAGITVLAIDPSTKESVLEPMMAAAELVAAEAGCSELTAPVPVLSRRALDAIFSRGYTVWRVFERMMWIGSSGINEVNCNLCSWMG